MAGALSTLVLVSQDRARGRQHDADEPNRVRTIASPACVRTYITRRRVDTPITFVITMDSKIIILVLAGIVIIPGVFLVTSYNGLVSSQIQVDEAWAQVQVQY